MFKVGDRVSNINEYETHKGEKGTIIEVHETYQNPYLVEYDNHINGHSGNESVIGKDGHCWWEREGTIEKIRKGDNMNLLEKVCKDLGVEVGEEWVGEWTTGNRYTNYSKFKFTETELMCYRKDYKSWVLGNSFLSDLIYGRLKPVWKPKLGDRYYCPYIDKPEEERFDYSYWEDSTIDNWFLENGLAFRTAEEAIECTNKMLEAIKERN